MTDLPRENVQSYPRPQALEPVPQRIIVRLGGALVADTKSALQVPETHHAPTYYLPPLDIHAARTSSVKTRIARNGWSAGTRSSSRI